MKNDLMTIGKIGGAHGVKGELKVIPITDDITRFYDLDYFLCGDKKYTIESVRIHKNQVLIMTEEIKDRNLIDKMRGKPVQIYREDAVELQEGQYFIEDLKGITIQDETTGVSGIIKDILQTGAADIILYEIDGKEWMMPYLNEYVSSVDLENGVMKADLSKGLQS